MFLLLPEGWSFVAAVEAWAAWPLAVAVALPLELLALVAGWVVPAALVVVVGAGVAVLKVNAGMLGLAACAPTVVWGVGLGVVAAAILLAEAANAASLAAGVWLWGRCAILGVDWVGGLGVSMGALPAP